MANAITGPNIELTDAKGEKYEGILLEKKISFSEADFRFDGWGHVAF